MLLLNAKLIMIKSWAVSCAKRRVGYWQREKRILQELRFVCPGLEAAIYARTVYFHLLTIQTPLKGHMLGCRHCCQEEKWSALWPLMTPVQPPACLYRRYASIYLHNYYYFGFSCFIWPPSTKTQLLMASLNLRQTLLCVNFYAVNEESQSPCWITGGKT